MTGSVAVSGRWAVERSGRAGRVVFVGVALGWVVVLVMLGRHRIVVSHDSLSNYTHVWWIQHRLWHDGRVPWRFPALAGGHGIAFPYGSLPWIVAALLWPLLGEWSVTLCLIVGSAAALVTMLWAFPQLGRGWWAATALANPALVDAPIVGMIPFL